MGMLQNAAEAYMAENPGETVSVSGGGTDRAIKSLIDGTCDIAMASAEANDELTARAGKEGVRLVRNVIAYDAIVPFAHLDNPVSNLTIEQLSMIYTGKITNWKDVGGNDSEILLTSRNLTSGTYEGWKLLVIGKDAILPQNAVAMDSIPERALVSQNANGIGYAGLNYIDGTVKPLAVEGIHANLDTITDGSFPLKRDLILYTREDAPPHVKRFVQYVMENGAAFVIPGTFPRSAQ
jgi:phosphate transport system substrate-binding protein